MGYTTQQPSSSAREQSLLRSLSVIRRPPKDGSSRRLERSASRDGQAKRGRCGKLVTSESARQGSRNERPNDEAPSPDTHAVTPPTSRDAQLPTLPFPEPSADKTQRVAEDRHSGIRRDYALGDTVRSPSHMAIAPSSAHAIRATSSLRKNDFAFVKRSDGSFSYALLAYRCREPFRNGSKKEVTTEECLVFVVGGDGSTKMVRMRHSESVRLVSVDGSEGRQPPRNAVQQAPCQDISNDDFSPPSMISFVPMKHDDECSLISSVSDRAKDISRRRRLKP